MQCAPPSPPLRWDIFCRVIDNFGDIGVCWRLAVNLVQRGQQVRLWLDDASALAWIAPTGATGVSGVSDATGQAGVQVLPWRTPFDRFNTTPGDVLVEAFGCEIDATFIAAYADSISASGLDLGFCQKCVWINLEYLSAEPFAQRCHGLPSPVMSGPGRGLTKHFFYPGFTAGTGGLLREPDLLARQTAFDRSGWLAQLGIDWRGERLVSLFCYEPAGLSALLQQCAQDARPTRLLVTTGRAATAVRHCIDEQNRRQPLWNERKQLLISYLPALTQPAFDHLLWSCDLNFVRGEDSLVRALWAGKPFIWQIYPQHDNAHHAKLEAFLDWLQAPTSLHRAHICWNGIAPATPLPALLAPQTLEVWRSCMAQARTRLLAQDDLTTQLLALVQQLGISRALALT
ncbi:MAG: elongation factor P maturation arginine rhamnosyltransferase EarP [Rhodoferax sp.]|nr:elongation factor P maturation arginine rhamnosyltransferase EarP [Rhodoferax sp.]